ncbi:hypothetical protein SKAU_G00162790 [Synaphobranchus kaupii]|uniref:Uncharacterized protein n=1 Tax=Synaphobranchus kaupii TaxID=118154 RepID=A0A9Q1FJA3_SYNKA|nr:hypothetical protein SKAU_G00162790 [Synaphobranchus kaupii]
MRMGTQTGCDSFASATPCSPDNHRRPDRFRLLTPPLSCSELHTISFDQRLDRRLQRVSAGETPSSYKLSGTITAKDKPALHNRRGALAGPVKVKAKQN